MSTFIILPQRFVDVYFVILHPVEADCAGRMSVLGECLKVFFDEQHIEHPQLIISSSDEAVVQEKKSFISGYNATFSEDFIFEDHRFDSPNFSINTPKWKRSFDYIKYLNKIPALFRGWVIFAVSARLTKILWFCTNDFFLKIIRYFPFKRSSEKSFFIKNFPLFKHTYAGSLGIKGGEIVHVRFIFSLELGLQINYFYKLFDQ